MRRVLYIHQYFNTPDMAGSIRSYEFCCQLAQDGFHVVVISSDRSLTSSATRVENVARGVSVIWIPVRYSNSMGFGARLGAFFRYMIKASIIALKVKCDLVIATSTPLTVAIPGAVAKWRSGARYIFEVRDLWPRVPIFLGVISNPLIVRSALLLERFAYKSADHVVALSPDMVSGVKEVNSNTEVTLISNMCHEPIGSNDHVPEVEALLQAVCEFKESDLLVTYIGTMGYVNDLSYLLRVAKACLDRSVAVKFLLVGDGQERAKLTKYSYELGINGVNLMFVETVSKSIASQIFAVSEVSVSTVRNEPVLWGNSANKFFDGLSHGCAVMINHGGWLAELIREMDCGLVCPPDDEFAAVEALMDLSDNRARLSALRANAIGLGRASFSAKAQRLKFSAVVDSIFG